MVDTSFDIGFYIRQENRLVEERELGMTSSLCLNVGEFITISHNIMVFCFEIFDMVVVALDT